MVVAARCDGVAQRTTRARLAGAARVTPVGLRQGVPCSLSGDGRAPGFGIARSESEAIAIAFGEAVADLPAQAMLVANAIEVSLRSGPSEVHEGHDGPGARESIDATAQIGVFPLTVRCGPLFNNLVGPNLASLRGPLAGVTLTWSALPAASGHGTLNLGEGAAAGARRPVPTAAAEVTPASTPGKNHRRARVIWMI